MTLARTRGRAWPPTRAPRARRALRASVRPSRSGGRSAPRNPPRPRAGRRRGSVRQAPTLRRCSPRSWTPSRGARISTNCLRSAFGSVIVPGREPLERVREDLVDDRLLEEGEQGLRRGAGVDRGHPADVDRESKAVGGLDPVDAERAVAALVVDREQRPSPPSSGRALAGRSRVASAGRPTPSRGDRGPRPRTRAGSESPPCRDRSEPRGRARSGAPSRSASRAPARSRSPTRRGARS